MTTAADTLSQAERSRALGDAVVGWEDCATASQLNSASEFYRKASDLAALALGHRVAVDTDADLTRTSAHGWTRALRLQVLRQRHEASELIAAGRRLYAPARNTAQIRRVVWSACASALLLLAVLASVAAERIGDVLRIGDVSTGRPWVASSAHAPFPARGRLGRFEDPFFFHTATDPEPTLELDLGRMRWIRRVVVGNRVDCCADRAVPLVVEISRDHSSWREIARRTRVFRTLRFTIKPVEARWVRVRVLRPSMLHLKSVLIRA